MNYLDLFSGAGGFHLGLKQAGIKFKKTFFSEIDKNAFNLCNERLQGYSNTLDAFMT